MVMKRRVPGILENLLKNKEETRYANLAYVSIVLLTILSFRLFFMQIIEGSYRIFGSSLLLFLRWCFRLNMHMYCL